MKNIFCCLDFCSEEEKANEACFIIETHNLEDGWDKKSLEIDEDDDSPLNQEIVHEAQMNGLNSLRSIQSIHLKSLEEDKGENSDENDSDSPEDGDTFKKMKSSPLFSMSSKGKKPKKGKRKVVRRQKLSEIMEVSESQFISSPNGSFAADSKKKSIENTPGQKINASGHFADEGNLSVLDEECPSIFQMSLEDVIEHNEEDSDVCSEKDEQIPSIRCIQPKFIVSSKVFSTKLTHDSKEFFSGREINLKMVSERSNGQKRANMDEENKEDS